MNFNEVSTNFLSIQSDTTNERFPEVFSKIVILKLKFKTFCEKFKETKL